MLGPIGPWLAMLGFGAFHGLNPGMGWLFALSLGLQQQRERVIWLSLLPIAAGHALAISLAVVLVLLGLRVASLPTLQWITAGVLLLFGLYKLFNYYRHPRWVGMKVGFRDLFLWSFLMATAHGAGLMVVPALLGVAAGMESGHAGHAGHGAPGGGGMLVAVILHTLAMLLVMGTTAWFVYRKFGLAILRQQWVNFDLIWAFALLAAAGIAALMAL
ncbi:hypothetical protein [Microbulbifer yueqingensis]|uniref:Uncharacterized protein n=1 Tax=Microbulbifer yueqingensis TaxID=658219 RepID=A0A1G8XVS5_9GAMM|nr:hypothetical protein [Microbulbifer yueqingensis]SDJ93870.1 hypothetical protein SAMN05216212_1234 [Microbulbifer yueqingensis]